MVDPSFLSHRHPHHLRARLPDEPEELASGPHAAQGLSAPGHCQELPAHVHRVDGAPETGDGGQEVRGRERGRAIRHGHVEEQQHQRFREMMKAGRNCV